MKRITAIIFIGITVVLGTSCKKYLDINTNPNQATSATPELILPQAITGTSYNINSFNSYGSQLVGYAANAGGYGGFGVSVTYNFSTGDFNNLWSSSYDNLEDYQAILNQTAAQLPQYSYYNAAARIMKAYVFEMLVDAYNDVPYTEALKGADKLTTKYDDAKVIYADLANQLDSAILTIHAGKNAQGVTVEELGSTDVIFKGDMTKWIQFANTIKLRLIVRAAGKATFSNTSFDPAGFLNTDALINPGFIRDNGKQNPQWTSWAFTNTLSAGNKAWMPNKFVFSFYNGTKLSDDGRGEAIYYQYPSTGTNQLGHEGNDVVSSPTGSFWYSGSDRTSAPGNSVGVLKGPDAGMVALLAAESYFLQAEAAVRGIISGDAKALFNKGIHASFNYLYQLPSGTVSGNPDGDANDYIATNAESYLVNFDLADNQAKKIEAIITQKYIALNFIHGHEAWNEYRRTHYPALVNTPGATGTQTFASTQSQSTRPDKLPTRILYPSSEGSLNPVNVPKNIGPFTSFIFWALQ
jgi:hypothetical protein